MPFIQDEDKWMAHYRKKAMKQLKQKDMMQTRKEPTIKTNLVLPTTQLVAQAKSDMRREQKEQGEEYVPIKVKPEFATSDSSTSAVGGNTSRKRKATSTSTSDSNSQKKKKKRRRKSNKSSSEQKKKYSTNKKTATNKKKKKEQGSADIFGA